MSPSKTGYKGTVDRNSHSQAMKAARNQMENRKEGDCKRGTECKIQVTEKK